MYLLALVALVVVGGFLVRGSGFRSASRPARSTIVALTVVAAAFCAAVLLWDVLEGSTTSTEPLVVVYAGVPLIIAVAIILIVDAAIRARRRDTT